MSEYPPEPWNLAGQAYLTTWRVPVDALPALADGLSPVVVAGRAVVVTAWLDYQPPGRLSYHELLATVAVRAPSGGLRATGTITDIWVDSEVSLAGGRALWGIPKDLAAFDFTHGRTFTASASLDDGWIATAAFTRRAGLPFAPPAAFRIAQELDGALKHTPVRSTGRPHLASANWNLNPDGPLGFLAGRRPGPSAHLADFRLTFGE
ncbi:acetoacetate decarboxylase family protein [Amycolatopsis albispora]|uniref:Acetoacetate decarboxylase n=1 Tax=Amycolatopsis albispora TaxID=1804986 RepID=A0A344L1S3_9PSEU|nr:acetoacetate decarboxylase family protein [Amycolatopsis albispora]AXB41997.1 acetoacetate decarboxylase [Amycolatopsis albispora]